jgi:hypothetical protein
MLCQLSRSSSARSFRGERELEVPGGIIYPVSRLLLVRIDMREPADATPHDVLQVDAVLIKKIKVGL